MTHEQKPESAEFRTREELEALASSYINRHYLPDCWNDVGEMVAEMMAAGAVEQRRKDAEGIEEAKDEGANFVLTSLAMLFGKDGFEIRDGSETWEGDVNATLEGILKAGGLIDDEGDIRNVAALEDRVKELEAVVRGYLEASDLLDACTMICPPKALFEAKDMALHHLRAAAIREGGEHG